MFDTNTRGTNGPGRRDSSGEPGRRYRVCCGNPSVDILADKHLRRSRSRCPRYLVGAELVPRESDQSFGMWGARAIDSASVQLDCIKTRDGGPILIENPASLGSLLQISAVASRDVTLATFNYADTMRVVALQEKRVPVSQPGPWLDFGPGATRGGTTLAVRTERLLEDIRITVTIKAA